VNCKLIVKNDGWWGLARPVTIERDTRLKYV
jgi:hypothetical protein